VPLWGGTHLCCEMPPHFHHREGAACEGEPVAGEGRPVPHPDPIGSPERLWVPRPHRRGAAVKRGRGCPWKADVDRASAKPRSRPLPGCSNIALEWLFMPHTCHSPRLVALLPLIRKAALYAIRDRRQNEKRLIVLGR
jgi:hypothetical protein